MKHDTFNCQLVASHVVDNMSIEDLKDYVFDDLYHLYLEDKEIFDLNAEQYEKDQEEDEDGQSDYFRR